MPRMAPNRLKELRSAQGFRLLDMGEQMGVALRTVNRWERMETQIPDHQKVRLAALFGVTVAYLMRWDT